ncbi:hypothetical protein LZC95_31080 [Pendulispora brunnea]|uniref:Cytochrome c domain-containing protein n=1 Tax=Pendulispora brunnea TaxID=2905690 RepID=A0ABZ2JWN0_9BACT
MRYHRIYNSLLAAAIIAGCSGGERPAEDNAIESGQETELADEVEARRRGALTYHLDPAGIFANYSTKGQFDEDNEFFANLGTNGRSCATCHRLEDGLGLTTWTIQRLYYKTRGRDPLFAVVDAATRPDADVSTEAARQKAYGLLLNRGVFRISLPMPQNAEFTLESIEDPYNFSTPENMSLYRRPLPAANTKFVAGTAIMWDGREPDLGSQANTATLGHAQASGPLTQEQKQRIVDFETNVFTSQVVVWGLGRVSPAGGGPINLSKQPFVIGENALPLPRNPRNTNSFNLFEEWTDVSDRAQQAVRRGEVIFNSRSIGKNPLGQTAFCTSCHSSFNQGGNDFPAPGAFANIGSSGGGPALLPGTNAERFLSKELPIYTFKNIATGATTQVNDPGRALISGKWLDIGRFKVPTVRNLGSHAPYFHNGSMKTLMDVVVFYDLTLAQPAGVPFTEQEKLDLVAFLQSL